MVDISQSGWTTYYLVPLPSYVNILACQVFLRPEYVIIVTQLSISLVC